MNLSEELIRLANEGYAPTLIYDDKGHWGISDTGTTAPFESETITWINVDLMEVKWGNTPDEAMELFIKNLEEK